MLDKYVHEIKVKVIWTSIYTLLPIPADENNPGDNGYMMKRVLSPVQYV